MATTPLGPAGLAALLGDQARVRVRNATAPDDLATIVAVALARHADDGSTRTDAEFGLELAAGEEAFFEPQPASAEVPALLEVLLRLRIAAGSAASADGELVFVDLYLQTGPADATEPARGFDCGVRRHDGEIEADEQLLPGLADLSAFARAVR
ncbi:MAG: hypothetical protein V4795_03235 [Pseudomonadota bacterium]